MIQKLKARIEELEKKPFAKSLQGKDEILKEVLLIFYRDIIPHENPEEEVKKYLSKDNKGITQVLLELTIDLAELKILNEWLQDRIKMEMELHNQKVEILQKIDKIIKDNLHSKHHNCLLEDLKKVIEK